MVKTTVRQKVNKKRISNLPAGNIVSTKGGFGGIMTTTKKSIKHRRKDIDFVRIDPKTGIQTKVGRGAGHFPALKEEVANAELARREAAGEYTARSEVAKFNAAKDNQIETSGATATTTPQTPNFFEKLRDLGVNKEEQAAKLGRVRAGTEPFFSEPFSAEDVFNAATLGLGGTLERGVVAGMKGLPGMARFGGKTTTQAVKLGDKVDVDKLGAQLGFDARQTRALAVQVGNQRISMTARKALTNPYFAKTGRVMLNAKTQQAKGSYLTKLAATATSPGTVLGILGATFFTSLFWAPNEKGDAMMTLGIVQRDAADIGDLELVEEINQSMSEANDIVANVPVIGFAKAEKAKFAASMKASEVSLEVARINYEKSEKVKGGN